MKRRKGVSSGKGGYRGGELKKQRHNPADATLEKANKKAKKHGKSTCPR